MGRSDSLVYDEALTNAVSPNAQRYPGLSYRSVHGLALFACVPYSATLSTKACAARYVEAGRSTGRAAEKIALCRMCPIGAAHAGADMIYYSRYFDVSLCPRCHKSWLRMIGNRVCVSCYNRERELASGRDAKGKYPAGVKPLYVIDLHYTLNGRAHHRISKVVDRTESVLHLLRHSKGNLTFGFTPDTSRIRQGALL